MTSIAAPACRPRAERSRSGLAITLRFALRNLRSGLRGFGIFLGCIALGVAAIAGVGSMARSLSDGLASQGRLILGGDVSASLLSREATPEELAFLKARGRVTSVATMRSMARTQDGRSALVEPKAVDANYPARRRAGYRAGAAARRALRQQGRRVRARSADGALFSRLGLKVGDGVLLGEATHRAARGARYRSRTSWQPASISARGILLSARTACAPPACCSPAAWCAGPIASRCRATRPTTPR